MRKEIIYSLVALLLIGGIAASGCVYQTESEDGDDTESLDLDEPQIYEDTQCNTPEDCEAQGLDAHPECGELQYWEWDCVDNQCATVCRDYY